MSITSKKITSTTVLQGVSPSSLALPVISNDFNPVVDDLTSIDARVTDIEDGTISFATHIEDTTASTTTTTGSFTTAGGAGIAGALFVSTTTPASISNTGVLSVTNATASSSTITGAVKVSGGVGIAKELYVSTTTPLSVSATGVLTVTNATDSSSITTGSILVTGGIGVSKRLSAAGFIGTVASGTALFVGNSTTQTVNDLFAITTSTAVASAALMKAVNVEMTTTAASASNMIEVSRFTLTSAVELGQWANAIVGKVDLSTTGYVAGLVGVICGELDMPTTVPPGGIGTYSIFEAEVNMAGTGGGVPIDIMNINIWGTQATSFDTYGNILDISGVSVGSGKVFQQNTAADATHALRIKVNGTPYYMLLTSAGA